MFILHISLLKIVIQNLKAVYDNIYFILNMENQVILITWGLRYRISYMENISN